MKNDYLINKIYSKRSLKRINDKILLLGSDSDININMFLNIKLLLLILTFIICIYIFKTGYIIAPIITITIYFLYDYLLLDLKIKERANIIEHDAIFFFEVLALTLKTESNLKLCLQSTADAIDSSLSNEFKIALKEVSYGKTLTESLTDLRKRIPSKSVNNVLLNIIEASMYGNSLLESLNNQIDYITDKRILSIKGSINKMPTKISIVSVVFFVPLIMLLILGPVIINYFFK